jgi:hypothetical protein
MFLFEKKCFQPNVDFSYVLVCCTKKNNLATPLLCFDDLHNETALVETSRTYEGTLLVAKMDQSFKVSFAILAGTYSMKPFILDKCFVIERII